MRKSIGIILDDQQSSIDYLIEKLALIEYVDIVKTFDKPLKAMAFLRKNKVDFIILDVELGSINAFEFLASLPDPNLPTILHTAHPKYEDRGYEMNLIDVLLKPVSSARLRGALRRVTRDIYETLKGDTSLDHWYDYFLVRGPARYERQLVWLKNVVCFESINRTVNIYQSDGSAPLVSSTPLREIVDRLPENWFKQCHKSYVFNINYFKSFKSNRVVLSYLASPVPVGRKHSYPEFYRFLENDDDS
ncbi:LytR/AlgR family response regulator transcription factor [Sphingobacterium corticis]|uniref:LytR/AlgR family response regulator transcription factor n=1 Tax=Sphingobacterium corticis TaxID=1812823 RepID=A0ABW5NJ38_9SPHI